jgi:HEAT repeat protein
VVKPRYKDLFKRMRDPDPVLADAAFDAVLFDREQAVGDTAECYGQAERDPILRFLCVQLLGFSGARAAIPTLLQALDDHDPVVRAEACRSLEDLRDRATIAALRARLDDLDERVRAAASEAIEGIEHPVDD